MRGVVEVGDTITLAARSGKSWQATVTEIVHKGDPALVATVGVDRAPSVARLGAVGTCDECGHQRTDLWPATDSSGIPGRVCKGCNGPSYMLSFA